MLHQVDSALPHAMSGIELSRVRPNSGSFLPKPINKTLIASRGADIVMQSSAFLPRQRKQRSQSQPTPRFLEIQPHLLKDSRP